MASCVVLFGKNILHAHLLFFHLSPVTFGKRSSDLTKMFECTTSHTLKIIPLIPNILFYLFGSPPGINNESYLNPRLAPVIFYYQLYCNVFLTNIRIRWTFVYLEDNDLRTTFVKPFCLIFNKAFVDEFYLTKTTSTRWLLYLIGQKSSACFQFLRRTEPIFVLCASISLYLAIISTCIATYITDPGFLKIISAALHVPLTKYLTWVVCCVRNLSLILREY